MGMKRTATRARSHQQMRARKRPRILTRPTETAIELLQEYEEMLLNKTNGITELAPKHRRVMFWDERFMKQLRGKVIMHDKTAWLAPRCWASRYDVERWLIEAEDILLLRDKRGLDISARYRAYTLTYAEIKRLAAMERMERLAA